MSAQTRSGPALLGDVTLPDRYQVVRGIAQGGMASVWCARDTVLGRAVAIKLLGEQFVHDDGAVRRFKREARAAARLSGHPHVITIFDVGQAEPAGEAHTGRPFIVMEYLSGGTVADALRVGAVDRGLALRWLGEAAAALDFAHGRGVIHRDIKPGNLLLDNERRLHVADLGIARVGAEDTITATGQLFGTAAYLSPEQALGQPAIDASDRYALAIVAYELLAGERPFLAEHFTGQARQHIEQQPPRASDRNHDLPRTIDAVLARGMAKRPEDRWGSAGAFVDAAASALREDAPTRSRPVFVAGRARGGAHATASHAAASRAAATPPVRPSIRPPITTGARAKPPPRAVALAALAAAAFGIGATAGASTEGSGSSRDRAAADVSRPAVSGAHATRHTRSPATKPSAHTTQTQTQTTASQTATGVPAAAPTTRPTADTLEARGHQLMLQGNYAGAIGVLHQALAAAAPGSLTYAYALFDLGRSLRLAGDPRAAAVVLQRRLQIRNQTDVVRHELELALRQIGAQLNGSGGAPVPPGHHDKGHHHDGGD